jgi:hypothetical protein
MVGCSVMQLHGWVGCSRMIEWVVVEWLGGVQMYGWVGLQLDG